MLWLAVVAPGCVIAATPGHRLQSDDAFKSATAFASPRAFVKGDMVRIYHAVGRTTEVFRADLKPSPIQGRDYVYFLADLKRDPSPPSLPPAGGHWREAQVVRQETWSNIVETTIRELTPAEPWQGAYFQLLSQERILYRDDAGQIRAVRVDQKPVGVDIARRYTSEQWGTLLADHLSRTLENTGNPDRPFLLMEPVEGQPPRFMMIDADRKTCAFLFHRASGDDPGGGFQVNSRLRFLTSLLIESHGIALVKNPVSSGVRLLNTIWQVVAGLLEVRLPAARTELPEAGAQPGMDLVEWEQWLSRQTGRPPDQGSVTFLINGEEFFPAFIRRLEAARHEAHVRICIFDNDDVAVEIADRLKRRSTDIQVRVLMDLLSTQASQQAQPETPMREGFIPPRSIHKYLQRDSRVKVRSALNPWLAADHTKVLTIDRQYAFLGGMNIGREYRHEWHDLMVEVEGPIVARLEHDFQKAWAHAGFWGDLAYLGASIEAPKPARLDSTNRNWAPIRRLYTRTGNLQIRKAVLEAFRRARNHIFLENSYLYDPSVASALITARGRGVDVRVILPERSDILGGNSSTYVTANSLFKNGIRVYIYPGMTHVKALLVDGWACFGSANFNRLSLRRNLETNLATSDPGIAHRLRQELFEEDFAKSHLLAETIEVNWTDYLLERILNQF